MGLSSHVSIKNHTSLLNKFSPLRTHMPSQQKSELRRTLLRTLRLPDDEDAVQQIRHGTLRLRRLCRNKLDGSLQVAGVEGPRRSDRTAGQYLARCLSTGELATLATLQAGGGGEAAVPPEVARLAQSNLAHLRQEERRRLSQPLVHHLAQQQQQQQHLLAGGGGGRKKASTKKKAKKAKNNKKVCKGCSKQNGAMHGYPWKGLLAGCVDRGTTTTLRVDGDSSHPNLNVIKGFAKKEGYKKVRIVNMTERDEEYTV